MGRAKAIIAILAAAGVVACQPTSAQHADPASAGTNSAANSVATPAPSSTAQQQSAVSTAAISTLAPSEPAVTTAPSSAASGLVSNAIAVLATLAVKGRAPMTGYTRDQFGPDWPTMSGCDQRNLVLRRDLVDVVPNGGCQVSSGSLISPYTGATIQFVRGPNSADVQIDHVVSLGDAWQKGAQSWTAARRQAFANDPRELLAVDGRSNEQKGDGDAASWLPSNKPFRCSYLAVQVNVKASYQLWVTQAEHDAMAQILTACPAAAPVSAGAPVAEAPSAAPQPVAAPPTTTAVEPAPDVVHGGAFCATAGATGVTSTGKPEVCKTSATDARLRWRAA